MSQPVGIRSMGIVALGIFTSIVLPVTLAEAKVTKEEKILLRQAATECKAEAKSQKVKWGARRKWVRSCVVGKLSARPGVNVQELLRTYPDLENLPKADVRNPI